MSAFQKLFAKIKVEKEAFSLLVGSVLVIIILGFGLYNLATKTKQEKTKLESELAASANNLKLLRNQDQYKVNQDLMTEISTVSGNYKKIVTTYEDIVDLDDQKGKTEPLKKEFAQVLSYLADRNYSSSSATFTQLASDIKKEKDRIASTVVNTSGNVISQANLPANNAPPGNGFSRQSVSALGSNYVVDIVAGDLGSTRVIVDTASDDTCHDNCPVMSLGDYVGRNGAYAGVNGSYFCPADYPSCAGKVNSFDTLAMNVRKHYLNGENNVYSTVPAVIFLGGSVRFIGASQEWGRDTGPDGVLANQPLLVAGGNVIFGGDGDPKKGSKGNRSFVSNKGNTVYIGTVHNVTVAEMANVLKTMGMDNALNLDSGGSVALWANGGYQDGPGRAIPNAILFVRK